MLPEADRARLRLALVEVCGLGDGPSTWLHERCDKVRLCPRGEGTRANPRTPGDDERTQSYRVDIGELESGDRLRPGFARLCSLLREDVC